MFAFRPGKNAVLSLILITVILLNALAPTAVSAKSSISQDHQVAFAENHARVPVLNDHIDQEDSEPSIQENKTRQQFSSGRKMTLVSVTAERAGGTPVTPPDGIDCYEYGTAIRCDFNLTAVGDGFWGSWWYRAWTVQWNDSEPGD